MRANKKLGSRGFPKLMMKTVDLCHVIWSPVQTILSIPPNNKYFFTYDDESLKVPPGGSQGLTPVGFCGDPGE